MTDSEIKRKLRIYSEKIKVLHKKAMDLMEGRQVKIISDFNGQPYGRSKKSMKGQIRTVQNVSIDSLDCYLRLNGELLYIGLDEVEFLGE